MLSVPAGRGVVDVDHSDGTVTLRLRSGRRAVEVHLDEDQTRAVLAGLVAECRWVFGLPRSSPR